MQRGITLKENYTPDLPLILLDINQIKQAFLNILKNSFEAMPEGGKISISTRLKDNNIVVSITDTGSGINKEEFGYLAQLIEGLPRLVLRGIMAIPKANPSTQEQQATLSALKEIFDQYHTSLSNFDTLSVGMSSDMAEAIQHGSTMVRIGTAIFGKRN